MNGWVVVAIILGTPMVAATIAYLLLVVYAATQLRHVLRGELEPDDDGEGDA